MEISVEGRLEVAALCKEGRRGRREIIGLTDPESDDRIEPRVVGDAGGEGVTEDVTP